MPRVRPADDPPRQREGFPGQRMVIIPRGIIRRNLSLPLTRDLCVTHIGHFNDARGHFVHRLRGTPQHILICCVSGAGFCSLAGKKHSVNRGSLVFLPPDKLHSYGSDDRNPWSVFWVHFSGARAADYPASLGASADNPVIMVRDSAPLRAAYDEALSHALHGFSDASMVAISTGFGRLIGLARTLRLQRNLGTRARNSGDRLLLTLEQMRAQPNTHLTIDGWARAAGMSTVHFTARVREQTGLPPGALLIRTRLQLALDLLQRGTHNVAEAAAAAGYDDPFYFSRLFRRHMGVPPSQCRSAL